MKVVISLLKPKNQMKQVTGKILKFQNFLFAKIIFKLVLQ